MSNRNQNSAARRGPAGATASITLASGSPRRRDLVGLLGLPHSIEVPDVPEVQLPGEQPADLALRLSLEKALAVALWRPHDVVLAADTIVVLDGVILGKPEDAAEAVGMLRRLRNRVHLVYTGLAIVREDSGVRCQQLACTPVRMANYSEEALAAYVATGDPLDKAGAYAIQAETFAPVAGLEGCYTNVVGLPLCHLYRGLRALGLLVPAHPLEVCPQAVGAGCPWAADILSARPEGI
ncbi:MAG: septum formation protein Maf [Chloroflexi bacterium]|jgi:septum formation protein|nr:septum formation protein Maf [Chloroflexota bacterium]